MVLGAFGAHAAAAVLTPDSLATWDTAVQYHLVHALALLITGVLAGMTGAGAGRRALLISAWGFALGITLFSGSLYGLAFSGPAWFGPVTPLGGVAFIVGWLALAVGAAQQTRG